MNDEFNEIYKAHRSDIGFSEWLFAMVTHLAVKTQDTLEKLNSKTPSIISHKVEKQIKKLQEGDKQEWCKLIFACDDHNRLAYSRARKIAPFPEVYKMRKLDFRPSETAVFWEPFFRENGYATWGYQGGDTGYDSYALFYTEDSTIKQIVTTSIWLGWKRTVTIMSYTPTPEPTSPWRKDRLK